MATQKRVQGNAGRSKNGPVRVSYRSRDYSDDEVRDLLFQGYEPEQIVRRTGRTLAWVRAQPVPRMALKNRLVQRRGFTD